MILRSKVSRLVQINEFKEKRKERADKKEIINNEKCHKTIKGKY